MADNKTQIIITARDETRAAFQSVQASLGNLGEVRHRALGQYSPGWCCAHIGAFANTINNRRRDQVRGCARRYVGRDWRVR